MTERFQTDHQELDELFERFRNSPKSHVFAPLADACRKAGMLEEALEICARGLGQNPRYASGYVVQGKCLYDAGRAGDAQAAFDRVLELDPKNLVALKFLGIIHAERGDTARARGYFEHILVLDPGDREIRSRIEDVRHTPKPAYTPKPAPAAPHLADETLIEVGSNAPGEEETVELPDIQDEAFEGEPITLRDETITSDEIATITLADIYAAQGYVSRALKIYHEVMKRQPGNTALAGKIENLEREVAVTPSAAPEPEPVDEPEESEAPVPPPMALEHAGDPEPPVRAAAPVAAPVGSAIDPSRNYEQFKRWLKASSR